MHSQATQNKVFQNPIIILVTSFLPIFYFLKKWCPPFISFSFSFTCTSVLTLNSMKGKCIRSLYKLFPYWCEKLQGVVIWLLWSRGFVTKGWDAWTCHDVLRLKFPNMGWRLLSHWLGYPNPSWCHHNKRLKWKLIFSLIAFKKIVCMYMYMCIWVHHHYEHDCHNI